jgi:predicted RNA methylase
MLKDAPRMDAYAAAIAANADFIRGRVVLDVGAGSGARTQRRRAPCTLRR